MRGRPPKSIEKHKLDGTYRPDRHGIAALKPEGYPAKPAGLGKHGAWLWDFIIADLTVVTARLDTAQLAACCEWYDVYRCNMEALKKKRGNDYRAMQMAQMAFKSFDKLAMRFGLTPVDRQRLKITPATTKRGVVSRMRNQA